MSVEVLYPAPELKVEEHAAAYNPVALRLAQLIMEDKGARQAYDDFMWEYVGHPDPELRDHGALDIDSRLRPIFSGYGPDGSLVHVRKARSDTRPDNYFVVLGDLRAGSVREMHVAAADLTNNSGLYYSTLWLQDAQSRRNAPPGFFDSKPPRDRLRLRLDLHDLARKAPALAFPQGQGRHELLQPIEQLCEQVMTRRLDQRIMQEVGRFGIMSVDTALAEVPSTDDPKPLVVNL